MPEVQREILAFEQKIITTYISAGCDRRYGLYGNYDPIQRAEIFTYILELEAMLRHKRLGGNFRSVAWKEHIPTIREEGFGEQNLFTPFEHEFVIGRMEFLVVSLKKCFLRNLKFLP